MFVSKSYAFEVMPISPYGGAYDYRTNLRLSDFKFLEDNEACKCFNKGRQIISKDNYPVHEAITRTAFEKAYNTKKKDVSWLFPLIAGSVWNDDPEYLMRKAVHYGGASKIKRFKKIMDKGNGTSSLTGRTHFGDLQYLHSMSSSKDEPAIKTKENIYYWLLATYNIAIGKYPYNTFVKDTPLEKDFLKVGCGATLEESKVKKCTLLDLFDLGHTWRAKNLDPQKVTSEIVFRCAASHCSRFFF